MKGNIVPPSAFITDVERRKRLGQYFTGLGLGRLLAALTQAETARTIIDPMAGTGDLLAACLDIGSRPETLAGVEIDEAALQTCQSRLPQSTCLLGSVFDPDVLARLPESEWDLVIANPPYVRYQSFSAQTDAGNSLPSARQIRTGLLCAVQRLSALDTEDKRLFAHLVSGYSGLSDLAVPSWILCAGLVKLGGRLALVVPESWLSRDYATIVHYLLHRWFEIEFVVEDEHASWFEDAQVKTTLIIAKRVKRRASVFSEADNGTYCHISLAAAAANSESPIGRILSLGQIPEKEFARLARTWLYSAAPQETIHARSRPVSKRLACTNVVNAALKQKWFSSMGETVALASPNVFIPHEIHDWLATLSRIPHFSTFEACGIAVGQGLRTGANGFFYADGRIIADEVQLTFGSTLGGVQAKVPLCIARSVLRRQSELPAGFTVAPSTTYGWVLDLRRHALREDIAAGDLISTHYEEMPIELAKVVRAAVNANFGTEVKPQRVWELTAVAPNIRKAAKGAPARYWYMLPDFASRHLPDVFLARVNAATPKAYLNEDRKCFVDANFSTMWVQPTSKWTASTLLAFMNSAWAQAVIECSGAVMGGGALKVEATHLRRLPLPEITDAEIQQLDALGNQLRAAPDNPAAPEILSQVDAIVGRLLGSDERGTLELRDIVQSGQARRAKHNNKRGVDSGNDVYRGTR